MTLAPSASLDRSVKPATPGRPLLYTPLDSKKPQIRLFKLAHSRHKWPWDGVLWEKPEPQLPEDLVGEALEVFDLHTAPPFAALSYEWGDARTMHKIMLGSASLEIRSNLYNLLRILNRRDFSPFLYPGIRGDYIGAEYIWVDQICINQQDSSEKSHQVLLMSQIYSQAKQVIAWLGYQIGPRQLEPHHRYKYTNPGDFLNTSYWQRLWIIQELFLAQEIRFIGTQGIMSAMLHWQTICGWLRGVQRGKKRYDEEFPAETPSVLKALIVHRNDREPKALLSLFDVIRQFSESKCLDPRDKVFGLLGMVKPEQRVNVDYTMTAEEVFHAALDKVLDTHPLGNPHQYILVFGLLAKDMGLKAAEEGAMRSVIVARLNEVEAQATSTSKGMRRNSVK